MPAIGRPLQSRHERESAVAAAQGSREAEQVSARRASDPAGVSYGAGGIGRGWCLRPVTEADAPVISRLEPVLFPDEAWDAASVREEITHPDRRYVAAVTESGTLCGYAGVMIAGDIADLHTIGTVHEGLGQGGAMLAWCESAARDGGAERILLEVREDNARARAFYERSGYEVLGVRRGYYRTPSGPVDAVVMAKAL